MSNSNNDTLSKIFSLVEKVVVFYIEYVKRLNLSNKIQDSGNAIFNAFTLLLISILLATTLWWSLLGLLYVYLQSLFISPIYIMISIAIINFVLLLVSVFSFLYVKKRLPFFSSKD